MEGQQTGRPNEPILIKCSLRKHSPEEIYDYLQMNIGDIGMKIKKGQAIIGFEDRQLYDKLLREHKIIKLHGKKLEFIPFPKAQQNYLSSEEQEAVDLAKCLVPGAYPEFKASNKIQARVNSCRVSMMDKIQQLFVPTIEAARQRVSQLYLQFKEQGPRERQMLSLTSGVEKKYKAIETRYEQDINKINKFINQFSMKPTMIDLEPTFVFEQTWKFPKISEKNMNFEPCKFFKNGLQGYSCKRLCSINGQQFAVSASSNQAKGKGYVKLFDVRDSSHKGEISVDSNIYGICRLNNFLLLGGTDATIKYLNLQDEEKSVESSKTLSEKYDNTFFDIKCFKKSVDKPQILASSTDCRLRRFEISFQQITAGLFTVSFQEKLCITANNCISFDILSPQVILYGINNKIRKYQMQKNTMKQVATVEDSPLKIKKFNENIVAIAQKKSVEMADLRSETIVQTFCHMPPQMKTLQVIGDHSMMFGAKGVIGLLDDRKPQVFPWKSEGYHRSVVYDILKLEDRIVSCDWEGKIYSWKLCEQIGQNIAPVEGIESGLLPQFKKR